MGSSGRGIRSPKVRNLDTLRPTPKSPRRKRPRKNSSAGTRDVLVLFSRPNAAPRRRNGLNSQATEEAVGEWLDTPAHWEARATEAYRTASKLSDRRTRQVLINIAESYRLLADVVQRRDEARLRTADLLAQPD